MATDHNDHDGHSHEGSAHAGHDAADRGDDAHHSGHGQYAEAMAKLSSEDRAHAEHQKACPVSGQPLGSMGVPYKVAVHGREVFLCCPGCEAKIKGDPEKYLAKLPE